ncbi:MAG: DUF3579 domain-containing protein [Gammaproteobacteria bacterium]|nr:DUF3579 domain-containing protein [Gammaproteobacteria bacterium]
MTVSGDYLVISGVREDGKTLRPTDWIERISSTLASFDEDRRLRYSLSVKPCIIEGEKCLIVARCLAQVNPAAYHFVMDFASSNRLKVYIDRRLDERAMGCELPPATAV